MEKKKKQQLPPDQHRCCQSNGLKGWRCKNFRMNHDGDNTLPKSRHCEKHYKYYAEIWKKKREKKTIGDHGEDDDTSDIQGGSANVGTKKKKLPPDGHHCVRTNGGGKWRCKNFRMGHGCDDDSVPKSCLCQKHYDLRTKYMKKKKKINGDGEGAGSGPIDETKGSGKKKVTEEENDDDTADTIVEGGSAYNGRKRKYAETREAVAELESLEHYKRKCFEFSVELQRKKVDLENKKLELEKEQLEIENMKVKLEKIKAEKKFELEEKELELEKMKLECTELQGRLAEVEETRNSTPKDEYWRNKCSDLESLVLRLELENSTMRCEASQVSNLESLVPRNGNESPIMRREVELSNLDMIESEIQDLHNMSKPNAETGTGGSKVSRVYELKTREKELLLESGFHKCSVVSIRSGNVDLFSGGVNVEEGEEKPSQHGSSSQAYLEMSNKTSGNLVSDSDDVGDSLGKPEDCTGFVDSQISLDDPMDTLVMNDSDRNKDEMEWKSEPELFSSFEEDPELCIKAVCALNRQKISEEEISAGLYYRSDILRWTTLAKLIVGENCKGDVMKCLKELETLDPTAVADCKKLARRYSCHLFEIYKNGKDPFFHPTKTARHGDHC